MDSKWKKKLIRFYETHKILGYIFIVAAAFFIVLKKRKAQHKSYYSTCSRRIALVMSAVIILTDLFSPQVIGTWDKAYGATSGIPLEWSELEVDYVPLNAIMDQDGNIYVFDWNNGLLKKYDKTGKEPEGWTSPQTVATAPIGLCFDKSGDILLPNKDGTGLAVVDRESGADKDKTIQTEGRVGGCACDEEGNIYVTVNGTMVKYNVAGEKLWSVKTGASRGLCIDNEGNLYTSNGNSSIIKVTPDGKLDASFGDEGKLRISGRVTDSGNEIVNSIGDPVFYNDNLYLCCHGSKLLIKILQNGQVLKEVASDIVPRAFIQYNNSYIIITQSDAVGKIQNMELPNVELQKDNFEFSVEKAELIEGGQESVKLSIQSDCTKDYIVKAKLFNKYTNQYASDITSSETKLQDGNAQLTLTPSGDGWKMGVYDIRLEFGSVMGSTELSELVDTNIVLRVGCYSVDYTLEHVRIEPMKEYIEIEDGEQDYSLSFTVMPEEGYTLSPLGVSATGGKVEVDGNDVSITQIQSDIKVKVKATKPLEITGVKDKGEYCESQTIAIQNEALDWVAVNDKKVTLNEQGEYVVKPSPDIQTITAADIVGNVISVRITVNDGHTFDQKEMKKEPNCLEKGLQWQKCSVCDYEEEQEIEALGHDWEEDYTIDVKPTKDKPGSKSIHCKRCDAVCDEKEILKGEISFAVVCEAGAPKVDAITTKEELSEALFSEEEKERILYGEDAFITLRVKDGTNTISHKDAQLIQRQLGNNILGQYIDVSLYKKIGKDEEIPVLQTETKIKFSLQEVGKPLDSPSEKVGKTFAIGVQGDETFVFFDLDEMEGTITIETDKFSTYAVAYEKIEIQTEETTTKEPEVEKKETTAQEMETTTKEPVSKRKKKKKEETTPIVPKKKNPLASPPKAGDENPVLWLFIMEMIVGTGVYMLCQCKRKKEKIKE